MKIRDMLEVAGEFQLKEFMWGEDIVETVKNHIPDCPITVDSTGNQSLSLIGEAIENGAHNVLEERIELEAVQDMKKSEVVLSWGKFSLKVTAGTIAALGSITAIYEVFTTGKMPTGETILMIIGSIAKLFA